jgi:hypothetical protein
MCGCKDTARGHVSVNMSCPHHESSLLSLSVVEPGGSSREREAMSIGKEVGRSNLAAEEEVSKKKHERENEKTYLAGGEH